MVGAGDVGDRNRNAVISERWLPLVSGLAFSWYGQSTPAAQPSTHKEQSFLVLYQTAFDFPVQNTRNPFTTGSDLGHFQSRHEHDPNVQPGA